VLWTSAALLPLLTPQPGTKCSVVAPCHLLRSPRARRGWVSQQALSDRCLATIQEKQGRSDEDADDVRGSWAGGPSDAVAFEELVEKHQALVAGAVARMLGQ